MATRSTLRTELRQRLRDTGGTPIWADTDLNGVLSFAIAGLYPSFWRPNVEMTTANVGPIQPMPANCRNLYEVGLQSPTSSRVRPVRGWTEGNGTAHVPKTGIEGSLLVWSWTSGYTVPTSDGTTLDIPQEAEEIVIMRGHIAALEMLLTGRVNTQAYLALNVREKNTEADIVQAIDTLARSIEDRLRFAKPLPEVKR